MNSMSAVLSGKLHFLTSLNPFHEEVIMSLAVCSIVRNEEKRLRSFVKAVISFADEIIVVDNNSSDNSASLAESLGCKVIRNKENTFDSARSLYIEKSNSHWILPIDMDESINISDALYLKTVINDAPSNLGAYYLPIFSYFGEGRWATTYHCRIYRNLPGLCYSRSIHGSVYKYFLKMNYMFGSIDAPIHHIDALLGDERIIEKRERNMKYILKQIKEKESASLFIYLSQEYAALGVASAALDAARQAIIQDDDTHSFAYLNMAQNCYHFGMKSDAVSFAKQQIEICKSKQDDLRKDYFARIEDNCRFLIAQCMLSDNQTMETLKYIGTSKLLFPEVAHNQLNYYLLTRDKTSLKKAMQLNPLLVNKRIYIKEKKYNLYRLQNSILDQFNIETCVWGGDI